MYSMCEHPIPTDPNKILSNVVDVNEYGMYMDSKASIKMEFKYKCQNCGEYIEEQTFSDIRNR